MPIIDVHSHLGDILYHHGGHLIYRKGIPMPTGFDIVSYNESMLQRSFGIGDKLYPLVKGWATKVERARNFAATLENMGDSLDELGIDYTVCLPIAPYVSYRDLAEARRRDQRILPFTSIDFALGSEAIKQVREDIEDGALGLKLHPIIQARPLNDPLVLATLQAIEEYRVPVLTHAGVSQYYLGKESVRNKPENGDIPAVEALVRAFPGINFVVGHAGLFQVKDVIKRLGSLSNVWVDTSFQPPEIISRLISVFGDDKVMYASDWPYGYRPPAFKAAKIACKNDADLEYKVFYENAAKLLGLVR